MACLDTTFLIDLGRRNGPRLERARNKLRALVQRGERLVTTRFTVAELYVGVFRCADPSAEKCAIAALLSGLDIVEFDETGALIFGRLTAHLQAMGRPAGDMDILIAATALAANEPVLVTRDPAHFTGIAGLRTEPY